MQIKEMMIRQNLRTFKLRKRKFVLKHINENVGDILKHLKRFQENSKLTKKNLMKLLIYLFSLSKLVS